MHARYATRHGECALLDGALREPREIRNGHQQLVKHDKPVGAHRLKRPFSSVVAKHSSQCLGARNTRFHDQRRTPPLKPKQPEKICEATGPIKKSSFRVNFRQFLNNQKLTVVKPGTQSRDFTHVNDIVTGLIKASEINSNHEWHLRSGINYSIIEVAEFFTKNWVFINERKGERFTSEEFKSDTNKILDWMPKHTLKKWINNIINE